MLEIAVRDGSKNVGSKSFVHSRLDVTSLLFVLWKLTKSNDVEESTVAKGLDSLQTLFESISKHSIFNVAHSANCIAGNSVS